MTRTRRALVVMGIAACVVMIWMVVFLPVRASRWAMLSCEHMATRISVTVPQDQRAVEALRIVSETFAEVDAMMSEWKPGSPLTEVNNNAGVRPVAVPAGLLDVIEEGIEIGEATDGAFDITWAALWGVWDFKAEHPVVPDDALIAERLALIDYRTIEIDREASTVFLPNAGMKIGLGGIAKGYALDVAAGRLRSAGFEDFLIVAGGQVYAGGSRGNRPWRLGIRDPRGSPRDQFATIDLHDQSASTSGDYERFFVIDGVRYHHILDPRTGHPGAGPRSVTVVSGSATLADALSTAGMLGGVEAGQVLSGRFGVWMLMVDQAGSVVEFGTSRPRIRRFGDPRP